MATTILGARTPLPGLRERPAKPASSSRRVSGRFRSIKWAALVLLLGIYYLLPWICWDRGPAAPDQAILVDMAGRRLYFFWLEIWPQEIYFLTGVLVLAAFGLFLATALFGRVWCGFACPQTVWTDLFFWVERLIEGDRVARMRLDRQPLTAGKAMRKTLKHAAWLLIALATGGAWVMYFNDAPTVVRASSPARPVPSSTASSACSPRPPTSWPAGRASRSAPRCPGRASRAACSTRTASP